MIKSSRFSVICLILFFVSASPAISQNVGAALNALAAHPYEKMYIHFDREYYVTGETIYFKAYLYSEGKPSSQSNNLYLQFTDSKGAVVSSKKYPVSGAVAKGSIDVPDSLPQGNYFVRALTPVMLNNDESFIYKKAIYIFKPGSNNPRERSTPQTVSVQFFPESGELIDTILTKLAFKANDQWGNPVDVTGVVHTDDGTTIASFKSYHDGIGFVVFKPRAGKKYIADVETAAGKKSFDLPAVKNSGISLKVQDEKGGKKFTLSRSGKDPLQANIKLVAQMNNQVVNEFEISFDDYPSIVGHLVTDSLPSGILHLTVFNNNGAPVAERLSFVNNREYIPKGSIITSGFSNAKRSANTLELNFDEAIQRSCSVSVSDASGSSFNDNDNIWSRLLLTSDLKGDVYNPAWYFEDNDSTKQGLDNLMLTHGWSRFVWTKILANQIPESKYNDLPLLTITGKVMDEKAKDMQSGGKLSFILEAEDSSSSRYEVPVDASGHFRSDSLYFSGKVKLYYSYTDNKNKPKPALIFLDQDPTLQWKEMVPAGFSTGKILYEADKWNGKSEIDTRYSYVKSRLDDVKELERVTVQSKSGKKPDEIVNDKYTTGVYRSPGKVNIDNINNPVNDKSMNGVDFVKNRVQQIDVVGNQFVNRKNFSLMSGQKWTVGLLIDEAPADIFMLKILRADQIALVKFWEAGFVGVGSTFPGGALAVYTKEKDKTEEKPANLNFVEFNGYSIAKQFYMPDYSNPLVKPQVDNRTTLYWNPDLITDSETKSVKLNYFNNDFSKKVKVTVEGFDANGKLIHMEKTLGN